MPSPQTLVVKHEYSFKAQDANGAQEPSPCFTRGKIQAQEPAPNLHGHPIILRPELGTQCHTARRLYVSRIANFRSSSRPQIRGSEQGCELPPLRQGWRIWREPRSPEQELERLVCSASYDRALCHASHLSAARINSLNNGCGRLGRDLNSGWNCEATNQG